MASLKHTHALKKWTKRGESKEQWWKCADPACSYIAPESLIKDKESVCTELGCLNVVLMDWKQRLSRTRAICLEHQKGKEGQLFRERKTMASALMESLQETKKEEEMIMDEIVGREI